MVLTIFMLLTGLILLLGGLLYFNVRYSDNLMDVGRNFTTEKNRLWVQIKNQDQELRNVQGDYESARREVVRLTNKMIEVTNHATLIEKDARERIEDFKKHPTIACMSDNQVTFLAEMLAIHIRQIMDSKKEYVN